MYKCATQLTEWCNNSRLLISAQLDKLLHMHAFTLLSSEQLNYLLNTSETGICGREKWVLLLNTYTQDVHLSVLFISNVI